jgi:hypothetical protein
MSISDFINDPFGAAGKAMADLAPDGVRETVHDAQSTLHDMAESAASPTLPDASAMTQAFADGSHTTTFSDGSGADTHIRQYADEHGIAGPDDANHTLGELSRPDTHALGENTNHNPISVDVGPAQIEDPSPVSVDIGPAQIEPEHTAGDQAQYAGIDSASGTSDFGGMAAEGPATHAYDPGPYGGLGAEGPATPTYDPGPYGGLGAEGSADGSGSSGDFGGPGAAGPVGDPDPGFDIF